MKLVVNESFYKIQYDGRGPNENYPDRKSGSHFGLYNTTPSKMSYLEYVVPTENGNRSDCRFISFRDKNGEGFCLMTSDKDGISSTFDCSAQLHSIEELHRATHTADLEPRNDGMCPIHVNIDHALMGLGGDKSWYPLVYPEFLVTAKKEYSFKTWLLPLRETDEACDMFEVSNFQYGI
jgi:Beta galactosidase small chain